MLLHSLVSPLLNNTRRWGLCGVLLGGALALASVGAQADDRSSDHRFVARQKADGGVTVVVAEGDFEARSIGSFSVRVYDAAEAPDETTFFQAGLIMARDGSLSKIVQEDIDGDGHAEVIVLVESAGSGGYLSAHAFDVHKRPVRLRASVEGLKPDADVVAALRKARKQGH